MTVLARTSLVMLDICRIYSEHRQTEVCLSEPDDYNTEVMCDFAERINPYDAINDYRLWKLLEAVFYRKEKISKPTPFSFLSQLFHKVFANADNINLASIVVYALRTNPHETINVSVTAFY